MHKEAEAQLDKVLEHCERFKSGWDGHAKRCANIYRGQNYLAQGHYQKAEQVLLDVLPAFKQQTGPLKPLRSD